jgi:hypothetical protein
MPDPARVFREVFWTGVGAFLLVAVTVALFVWALSH